MRRNVNLNAKHFIGTANRNASKQLAINRRAMMQTKRLQINMFTTIAISFLFRVEKLIVWMLIQWLSLS